VLLSKELRAPGKKPTNYRDHTHEMLVIAEQSRPVSDRVCNHTPSLLRHQVCLEEGESFAGLLRNATRASREWISPLAPKIYRPPNSEATNATFLSSSSSKSNRAVSTISSLLYQAHTNITVEPRPSFSIFDSDVLPWVIRDPAALEIKQYSSIGSSFLVGSSSVKAMRFECRHDRNTYHGET